MAMNATPYFPASVKTGVGKIVPADTTTLISLFTGGTNGSKVVAIGISSDDSATKDAQIWLTAGGVDYLLGTKTIPATAGFATGVPAFNFFDNVQIPWIPFDADGQRYIFVPASGVLKFKVTATLTAAKTMYCFVQGIDF